MKDTTLQKRAENPDTAAGLRSTTADLLKWQLALYGGKVLSAASLKKVTTSFKGDYGLGIYIRTIDGRKAMTHGGGVPTFANLTCFPDTQTSVVVPGNPNPKAAPAPEIAAYLGTLAHSGVNAAQLSAQSPDGRTLPLLAESETSFFRGNERARRVRARCRRRCDGPRRASGNAPGTRNAGAVRSTIMRTLTWCLAWSLSVVAAPAAMAQDRGLAIEYTVKVADIPGQLFHVTTDIKNINQPALDLSLPVWSPGWYVIENYAKNVIRFRVTEPGGRELRPTQVRKQTWRIETKGISRVTVEFDYLANVLSANQARIAADYAFFTGTQLFLLPEGHRSRPSRVRFDVPSGWKIASGLDETADPMVFTAPEYDTLVDQPTLMGQFDVTRFIVDGKPHDLVLNPPGAYPADKARTLAANLSKLAETQGRIFGGLPYKKFVYFYLFRAKEAAAAVLEHQNSLVILRNPDALPLPDEVGGAAHEFFHVWNVKRIRPVQMWPYDYSKENETPLLWVSEGFTVYYASLSMYRAGLRDARTLVAEMARGIGDVEGNEARRYISAADSSTSTWIDYGAPAASRISYYEQGRSLAQLLDLSIRHDTGGARGLDDVMRALFTDFYQRSRGFSTEDLIRVVNRVSGKSYESFFSKYVAGTDVPPYDTFLGYAGYQLERATRKVPFLGANLDTLGRVTGFPPGFDAATSRLRQDDFIVRVDGQTLDGQPAGTIFRLLNEKLGQNVKLTIRRGGEERELDTTVKFVELANYRIVESQSPTAEQLKIRESWLKR